MDLEFKTAELKKLYDYWSEKAGDRAMPSRGDLDPIIDIPELTSNIWLVDVERDPPGFRFRLLGTEVVAQYGMDFTGKRLDEMDFGGHREAIQRDYEETVRWKQPTYRSHIIEIEETMRRLPYERVLLPLSDDGEAVDMILGGGFRLENDAEESSAHIRPQPARAVTVGGNQRRQRGDNRRLPLPTRLDHDPLHGYWAHRWRWVERWRAADAVDTKGVGWNCDRTPA